MSNYENTYYEKFKQEYFKKYGTDFGFEYVGSAFEKRPNIDKVSAKELRNIMPMKDIPVKTHFLDIIEADCEKWMKNAARKKKYFCKYTIKTIYESCPPIDPKAALPELYRRITKRDGIKCYADPDREDTLVISWAHQKSDL